MRTGSALNEERSKPKRQGKTGDLGGNRGIVVNKIGKTV
jgi:hypothetical protein